MDHKHLVKVVYHKTLPPRWCSHEKGAELVKSGEWFNSPAIAFLPLVKESEKSVPLKVVTKKISAKKKKKGGK